MVALVLTKLILIPLVVVGFINLFGVVGVMAGVILLQAATPTMSLAPVLCQRCIGEAKFATSAVLTTVLFSIITIPLIMLLL